VIEDARALENAKRYDWDRVVKPKLEKVLEEALAL